MNLHKTGAKLKETPRLSLDSRSTSFRSARSGSSLEPQELMTGHRRTMIKVESFVVESLILNWFGSWLNKKKKGCAILNARLSSLLLKRSLVMQTQTLQRLYSSLSLILFHLLIIYVKTSPMLVPRTHLLFLRIGFLENHFVAKPSKDTEMDKILRSMQGMPGAPGMKVYSRDDIEKYKDNPGKFGNEDEEEEIIA